MHKEPLTVGLETMYRPFEQGEKKLLDIKSRNEAIELMKIKRYLKLDNQRPTWAKVANDLIELNLKIKKVVKDEATYQNIFLQILDISTRNKKDILPPSIKKIVKVVKKHNVTFVPLSLT